MSRSSTTFSMSSSERCSGRKAFTFSLSLVAFWKSISDIAVSPAYPMFVAVVAGSMT